jgi:hypothetical protein
MDSTPVVADELTRLRAVQARVRTLARDHRWFGDAIRNAFDGYIALTDRYRGETTAMHDRARRLARDLLSQGLLVDPRAKDNGPCLFVPFEGLCPVALAKRLEEHGGAGRMPAELERDNAAAALAALDRDSIYQAHDLPKSEKQEMAKEYKAASDAKTHVRSSWCIAVSRPVDWQEPADPQSVERADLRRFSEAEFRTIALHRLGGLADVGALRPIVPEPNNTGDSMRDRATSIVWRSRCPIDKQHQEENQPPLSVRALPPDIAEQMLDSVETWVKAEAAARVNPGSTSGQSGGTAPREPERPAASSGRIAAWKVAGAAKATSPIEGARSKVLARSNEQVEVKRPVLIAEAAEAAGKRSDVLLKMLRTRQYPIEGPPGAYSADLAHIIRAVPGRKKALLEWAERKYPCG